MVAAKPQALPLHTVPGVEIFATGEAHGQEWTGEDIDSIIRNAELLKEYVKPTVVIGHEQYQPLVKGMPSTWADNTGNPAFGVVANLRRSAREVEGVQTVFPVADFNDVPAWLAGLINAKAYRAVSAEVYDDGDPPDGVPVELLSQIKGPVLKRVAFLGEQLPRWKTLADVPQAEVQKFCDLPARRAKLSFAGRQKTLSGTTLVFCEVNPMPNAVAKVKKQLKKFSELSDKSKATLKKFDDAAPPADGSSGTPGVARPDMIAMLTDLGYDPAVLTDAVPDEVLAEMIRVAQAAQAAQAAPTQMADAPAPLPAPAAPIQQPTNTPPALQPPARQQPAATGFPTSEPSQVVLKYSDNGVTKERTMDFADFIREAVEPAVAKTLEGRFKPISDKIDAGERRVDEFELNTRKASIKTFCDTYGKLGHFLPKERAALEARLLRADGVKKFADGKSELESQMQEIVDRGNVLKFSEQFANPQNTDPNGGDAEVEKVKRHAASIEPQLKKMGSTAEAYVKTFADVRAKKPDFMARQYDQAIVG